MPASPGRQTMMLSATMPDDVRGLAADFLWRHVVVQAGVRGASVDLIHQVRVVEGGAGPRALRESATCPSVHLPSNTAFWSTLPGQRAELIQHEALKLERLLQLVGGGGEAGQGGQAGLALVFTNTIPTAKKVRRGHGIGKLVKYEGVCQQTKDSL